MSEYLENLNEKQKEAVLAEDNTLILIAGPGSGKTRVLTCKIAHLKANSTPSGQILAVTFTNKAAKEMKERLQHMLGEEAVRYMWVNTFHAACVKMLRENYDKIDLARHFTIYDQKDSTETLKEVLKEMVQSELPEDELLKEIHYIRKEISTAKNDSMSAEDYSHIVADNQVYSVWRRYQEKLTQSKALDFDDILLKTKELLEIPEVRQRYRKKFTYILIDEFQDTNKVQYDITKLLKGDEQKLCVVGDLDQAIYSFRGARPTILENLDQDFKNARVITLDRNYRSTKSILNYAKAIIEVNESKYRADLYTENELGDKVQLYKTEDDQEEAYHAVKNLNMKKDGSKAILVRTRAQTRLFERELTNQGTPYEVIGALRFSDRAIIKDALSYLELILNPEDYKALQRSTQNPKRKIGPKALEELQSPSKNGNDFISKISNYSGKNKGFFSYLEDLSAIQIKLEDSLSAAVQYIAEYVIKVDKNKVTETDNAEHLEELYRSAKSYEEENKREDTVEELGVIVNLPPELAILDQLAGYLANTKLSSSGDNSDDNPNKITLITAHASKGKEFDHVWVAGVEESLYPHVNSIHDPKTIEEERRLLYVAVTRARKTLSLSCASRRLFFTKDKGAMYKSPELSEFIREIPRELFITIGAKKSRLNPKEDVKRENKSFFHTLTAKPAFDLTSRVEVVNLFAGDEIEHATRGKGKVISITNTRALVQFENDPTTTLLEITKSPLKKMNK